MAFNRAKAAKSCPIQRNQTACFQCMHWLMRFESLLLPRADRDSAAAARCRAAGVDAPTVFSMEFFLTSFMVIPPFLDHTVSDRPALSTRYHTANQNGIIHLLFIFDLIIRFSQSIGIHFYVFEYSKSIDFWRISNIIKLGIIWTGRSWSWQKNLSPQPPVI